jgi:hypothetical protein
LAAGPVPAKTRSAALRVLTGNPIWSDIEARSLNREGPGPKAAGFVAGSSGRLRRGRPGYETSSTSSHQPEVYCWKRRTVTAVRRPQPAARFVFEKVPGCCPAGPAHRRSPIQSVFAGYMGPASRLECPLFRTQDGEMHFGFPPERTAPGKIRQPAIETRWKPLSPILESQSPAKIVLVL